VTRAAIYLRISKDDEMNGLAIDRQREDCLRIVEARGWDLHDVYIDQGISASKRAVNRPAYDAMRTAYAAGAFSAIVCYDLDRLTRQPRQLEDWIDAAEQHGLSLVTATGEADLSTDNGRLFARIKASVARAEIERKGARQRRANEQRVALGYPPPGRRLYGFETDGITPREPEAAIVRRVFDDIVAGSSIHGIVRALNAEAVPFTTGRSGLWTPKVVRLLVLNRRYAGEVIHHGAWMPSTVVTPIVPAAIAERVRLIVSDPTRLHIAPGNVASHLASGVVTCSVCHAGLTFANKAASRTPPSYRCPADHVTIAAHLLEPLLVRGLSEVIAEDAAALSAAPDVTSSLTDLTDRLDRNERAALATARDRDEGLLSDAAARSRLLDLRAERVELEDAIEAARREHSASGALLTLAGDSFDLAAHAIHESLRVAEVVAEQFSALPLDRQREVVRSLTYATVLPLRAPDGRRRTSDERVRVASRLQIERLDTHPGD
jgi:DNA invertase Pin-like site-specific DNA recombinase